MLSVGFVVTETGEETGAGDFFTALDLAAACRIELGWRTTFLARSGGASSWQEVSGLDVVVSLLDEYPADQLRGAGPGLIRVAWMRNWFQRWAASPAIQAYDVLLCSSDRAAAWVSRHTGRPVGRLRIGTDPGRFTPGPPDPNLTSDVCFTGNKWGARRQVEWMAWPRTWHGEFALYGSGWEGHRRLGRWSRGRIEYSRMPGVYRSTRLVLDDANHVTRRWGSVNSRVFDALAAGRLVLTNGLRGSAEVFGGRLPTYRNPWQLTRLVNRLLQEPEIRAGLASALRREVLDRHTYVHRARRLSEILGGVGAACRSETGRS